MSREAEVRSFRKILRRFERVQRVQVEDENACCGVTFAQCHPLLEIHELGRTTTGELAARLDLDKSTLSRTIDGLVRRGLVRRTTHDQDRRFLLLTLTPAGRSLCDEINRKNDWSFGQVLRKIPKSDRGELIRLFESLVQAMEDTSGSRADQEGRRLIAGACSSRSRPPTR